jgi:AcrR family transcriptional regulator
LNAVASIPATNSLTGKQRILEAAHPLFAEGAYSDIGVAQILEKAGVQAPTLYHHFGDKEGLYVAWAEQAFRRLDSAISKASLSEASTGACLSRYAFALLTNIDFDLHQVLRDAPRLQRPDSRERVLGAYMHAIYEPLATVLVQAIATGEFRGESVQQLADVYMAGLLAVRESPGKQDGIDMQASWWSKAFVKAFTSQPAAVLR